MYHKMYEKLCCNIKIIKKRAELPSLQLNVRQRNKKSMTMRFELTRAEPKGLAVPRLNHSATSSVLEINWKFETVDEIDYFLITFWKNDWNWHDFDGFEKENLKCLKFCTFAQKPSPPPEAPFSSLAADQLCFLFFFQKKCIFCEMF